MSRASPLTPHPSQQPPRRGDDIAKSELLGDHRFSEPDLVDHLGALRARALSHPDNPGLVACLPAGSRDRMAAACRVLAWRGHAVRPVWVAAWDDGKSRKGWTLGTASDDDTAMSR
jgi:hypothetical protein